MIECSPACLEFDSDGHIINCPNYISEGAQKRAVESVADTCQVGGSHRRLTEYQHWDMVCDFKLDYFQGQITRYLFRWRDKNGIEDLEEAAHYLEKYIEVQRQRGIIK